MGFVLGRKPEHETLCFSMFSRVKWLQAAMKGTSSVRRIPQAPDQSIFFHQSGELRRRNELDFYGYYFTMGL